MFKELPSDWREFSEWDWDRISPLANDLLQRELGPESLEHWLADWSLLARLVAETYSRLWIRTTTHTNDEKGKLRFQGYSEAIMPRARAFEQTMKSRLLESGLTLEGFDIPLQKFAVK